MEIQLNKERKEQYIQIINAAQEAEANIGALSYRLFKFNKMREEVEMATKKLWDELAKELNLDLSTNYTISREGILRDVPKRPVEPKPLQNKKLEEGSVRPVTIDDLK